MTLVNRYIICDKSWNKNHVHTQVCVRMYMLVRIFPFFFLLLIILVHGGTCWNSSIRWPKLLQVSKTRYKTFFKAKCLQLLLRFLILQLSCVIFLQCHILWWWLDHHFAFLCRLEFECLQAPTNLIFQGTI